MSLMSIIFRLGTDNSQLQTGLSKARQQVTGFSSDVKRMLVGAFAMGSILAGMRSLFTEMDRVQKLARRFGESSESIQQIGHAAKLSGADVDTAARALTNLAVSANRAATQGLDTYEKQFAALGISSREFLKSDLKGQLGLLAQAHTAAGADASKQAAMMELLGTRAADLIPMLDQGKEGLDKMFADAPTLADSTVDAIARANDAITQMIQTLKVWGGTAIGYIDWFSRHLGGDWGDNYNNMKNAIEVAEMQIDRESPGLKGKDRKAAIDDRASKIYEQQEMERHVAQQKEKWRIEKEAAEQAAAAKAEIEQKAADERAAKGLKTEMDAIAKAIEERQKLVYRAMEDEEKLAAKKAELAEIEAKSNLTGSALVENENNRLRILGEIAALESGITKDKEAANAALSLAQYDQLSDAEKLIAKEKQLAELQRRRASATGTELVKVETEILTTNGEILRIKSDIARANEVAANEAEREAAAAERQRQEYEASVKSRASEDRRRQGMSGQEVAAMRREESNQRRAETTVRRRDARNAAREEGEAQGLQGTDLARHVARRSREMEGTPGKEDAPPMPPGGSPGPAGQKAAADSKALATEATLKSIETLLDQRLPSQTS